MTDSAYELFYKNSQQYSPSNENLTADESIKSNSLQKYKVIKLIASGDYICHDHLGNYYLLVCQSWKGSRGLDQFKADSRQNFHRTRNNRKLITPFEDIEYNGLIYTAFMIPENASWLVDSCCLKFKSQIFCLSLLISLINKIIKPLVEIFEEKASDWLHLENMWMKESTIYYFLCKRKSNAQQINNSPRKSNNRTEKCIVNFSRESNEKKLLRKLCRILVPYFKMDHELKTFQSILIDAMLNEELTFEEVSQLINDKTRRKVFLDQRREKEEVNENAVADEILKQNGDFWRKKKFETLFQNRRGLKISHPNTLTIQLEQRNSFAPHSARNISEVISRKSNSKSKRNAFFTLRMFDFKQKSKKQNRSLSQQRSISRYQEPVQSNCLNSSQNIQKTLRSHVKYFKANSKLHAVNMNVKERAYKKFTQSLSFQSKKCEGLQFLTPKNMNKQALRNHLFSRQGFNSGKSKTIEIGQLKDNRNSKIIEKMMINKNLQIDTSELICQRKKPSKEEIFKAIQGKEDHIKQSVKNFVRFDTNESEKMQQNEEIKYQVEQKKPISSVTNKQIRMLGRNASAKAVNRNIFQGETENIDFQALQTINVLKPTLTPQSDTKQQPIQKLPSPVAHNSKPPTPKQGKEQKMSKANHFEEEDLDEMVLQRQVKNRKQSSNSRKSKQKEQIKPSQGYNHDEEIINQPKPQRNAKNESNEMTKSKNTQSQILTSCGPKKSVSKQVNEYMFMINRMGESVAKSSKISSKLEGIQWFTGIYFIYKRFLYERKNIEKWLQNKEPNLTRYQQKKLLDWNQWFNSEQKRILQAKVKAQNQNITNAIVKMHKKLTKKNVPSNFLHHAALNKHSDQQSKIAVSQVVKEYDILEDEQKLGDQEILAHVNDLLNSIYIIAELDGKIEEKKPLVQILRRKDQQEIAEYSDFLFQLYIKEDE